MANGNNPVALRWRFGGIVASSLRSDLEGALSGRVVFLNAGHGWVYDGTDRWYLQREVTFDVLEDFGNTDQLRFAVDHCLNLGATVVPFRAVGRQPEQVIVNADADEDHARAVFGQGWDVVLQSGPNVPSSRFFFSGADGNPRYRWTRNAVDPASFRFRVPRAGIYPVYVWCPRSTHIVDEQQNMLQQVEQTYVVHHAGGQTQRKLDHGLVANGWIYLGSFYFSDRQHRVEVLPPDEDQMGFVLADAVRIGNGTFSDRELDSVSFEEAGAKYWIESGLGHGIDAAARTELESIREATSTEDERGADRRTPSRMSRHMAGSIPQGEPSKHHVFLSFHSDSGGRGSHGLANRNKMDDDGNQVDSGWFTKNQEEWAEIVGRACQRDLLALSAGEQAEVHGFSFPWHERRTVFSIFDGKTRVINGREVTSIRKDEIADDRPPEAGFHGIMDATIVETGFHDNPKDSALLVDPKTRDALGRASARAVTEYFRTFDPDSGIPASYAPERPWAPRFLFIRAGVARLSWRPPVVDSTGGGAPNQYCVYLSRSREAFGSPTVISNSALELEDELMEGEALYARVTAINEAGESMPGPVVGARWRSDQQPILVVMAHEELVAENNPEQVVSTSKTGPLPTFVYRVDPEGNNSFDYVADIGGAGDFAFESCWASAVESDEVELSNYRGVIWCAGREGRRRSVLSAQAVAQLDAYCRSGGRLLIHGSRIATGLQFLGSAGDAGRVFASEVLGAALDRTHFVVEPARVDAEGPLGTELGGRDLVLNFGTSLGAPYSLWNHDSLVVFPPAEPAIRISNSNAVVGTVHQVGQGRVIYLAFPFEALETANGHTARRTLLAACLRWLGLS